MRRRFVIAAGTTTKVRNVFMQAKLEGGATGWGEHAPSLRVNGETPQDVRHGIDEVLRNPHWVDRLVEDATYLPGMARNGAANALTQAFLDAESQRRGEPANDVLNLPAGTKPSSVTLSIGKPREVAAEAEERHRQGWRVFKIKVGSPNDEAAVRAVRDRFPDVPIRIDANEGWTHQEARRLSPLLGRLGVEFIEQPLLRTDWDGLRALREQEGPPVMLDESVLDSEGLFSAITKEAGDGVVIKLSKCGGPFEARRMIKMARDHHWRTMVGCNLESSVAVAASACLVGACDYVDLDGNSFIANDPFTYVGARPGVVGTPDAPGIGVARAKGGARMEPIAAT